jgi:hypothetical protein
VDAPAVVEGSQATKAGVGGYTWNMMQTLTCRGQVVGKTIVLESELGLPDGAQVEVEIRLHLPAETLAQRQQALQRLFSMNLPVANWEQMEQETIRGAIEDEAAQ